MLSRRGVFLSAIGGLFSVAALSEARAGTSHAAVGQASPDPAPLSRNPPTELQRFWVRRRRRRFFVARRRFIVRRRRFIVRRRWRRW